MLDIFITKPAAVLAYGQSHAVAARFIICAGVFGEESLDRIATLDADGHLYLMVRGMRSMAV